MNAQKQMKARSDHDREAGLPADSAPKSKIRTLVPRHISGWDPYEVWRTRVKTFYKLSDIEPKR